MAKNDQKKAKSQGFCVCMQARLVFFISFLHLYLFTGSGLHRWETDGQSRDRQKIGRIL